jgi:hypothetical protein
MLFDGNGVASVNDTRGGDPMQVSPQQGDGIRTAVGIPYRGAVEADTSNAEGARQPTGRLSSSGVRRGTPTANASCAFQSKC